MSPVTLPSNVNINRSPPLTDSLWWVLPPKARWSDQFLHINLWLDMGETAAAKLLLSDWTSSPRGQRRRWRGGNVSRQLQMHLCPPICLLFLIGGEIAFPFRPLSSASSSSLGVSNQREICRREQQKKTTGSLGLLFEQLSRPLLTAQQETQCTPCVVGGSPLRQRDKAICLFSVCCSGG